jgi:TatA/E family protein of Tat protein translocase
MIGPLGMPELVVIFIIALIVFGPRKLPELGKSLGKSLAEFKRASNELRNSLEDEIRLEEDRERAVKTAPPVVPAPVVAPTPTPDAPVDEGGMADSSTEAPEDTTPRGAAV